jgi:hypothetical protein
MKRIPVAIVINLAGLLVAVHQGRSSFIALHIALLAALTYAATTKR